MRTRQLAMPVPSSCSQKRRTVRPVARSALVVLRSRRRLRTIFAFQKAALVLGRWPQRGQPCQKQPSTKTASRASRKKKSGRPGTSSACNFQPVTRARTKASRSRRSVVLLPRPRTARIAEERTGETPTNSPPSSLRRRTRSKTRSPRRRTMSWQWSARRSHRPRVSFVPTPEAIPLGTP